MRSLEARSLRAIAALAAPLLLALTPPRVGAESPADSEPRATMHRVFDEMAWLLPASLDASRWWAPARRAETQRHLDTLAGVAAQIEHHAEGQDVGFEFLGQQLASRLAEARDRYVRGEPEESRFLLGESVQTCVACHSRAPIAREFPLAERLVEAAEVEALLPHERAQLLVVTRRPKQALAVWEALLTAPTSPPEQLDIAGVLNDYLGVALRVERDFPRARRTLDAFARRPDLPRYLSRLVSAWLESLRDLESGPPPTASLDGGRTLARRAAAATRWPSGREGLVYGLVASGLLHEYVQAASVPNESVAEALYLLGRLEVRGVDSYWVPQASAHLEASIRMAPGAPFAPSAYALLEERTVLSYGGSSRDHLPAGVWQRLAELRGQIDASSQAEAH